MLTWKCPLDFRLQIWDLYARYTLPCVLVVMVVTVGIVVGNGGVNDDGEGGDGAGDRGRVESDGGHGG